MCLLAIVRNAKFEKLIDKIWEANPDGGGMAVRTKEGIRYKKGLDLEEFKRAFKEFAKQGSEFVVHFRLATSGPKSPILTHPFVVSPRLVRETEGTAKLVLFHNGVVTDWKAIDLLYRSLFRTDMPALSDTEAVARVLSKLDWGDRIKFLKLLGGKWLLYGKNITVRIGKWEELDGNLLSNKNWQVKVKHEYYPYYENWFNRIKKGGDINDI